MATENIDLLKRSSYYYDLPEELIAQTPSEKRDRSRLLVLNRASGEVTQGHFSDVLSYFKKGDCLEILSPNEQFKQTFIVEEVYDSQNQAAEDCKLVQEVYKIRCPYSLQEGDYLRRKVNV